MRILRYLRYGRWIFRELMSKAPWNRYKLRKKGSQFVLNYSDDGDAKLTIWLPYPSDKEDVIPVSDRCYDYAYTVEKFREYNIRGRDILDVGSANSPLPTILAAMGNHVVCIDVREWPVMYPNLKFVKCDLLESDIPFSNFDVITCVSTIEHFGLGRYGDKEDVDGDIKGMSILRKYLKPKGLMILTVPFGRATVAFPAHRVYDESRFSRLTSGYRILDKKFRGPIDRPDSFRPCSEEETYSVDTETSVAVVCCCLERENDVG